MLTRIFYTFLLLSSYLRVQGTDIKLVERQHSSFLIILPQSPTTQETMAAEELSTYINKSAHVAIPISHEPAKSTNHIFIGRTIASNKLALLQAKLLYDGYLIYTTDKDIYIYGNDSTGVLNGVYGFLSKFMGVEQLSVNEWHIPQIKTLKVKSGIEMISNPAFRVKDIYNDVAYNGAYARWYGFSHFFKEPKIWGLFGHSFFKLIPPKSLFQSHPEYFSQIKGKRQPSQLCLTNQKMVQLLTDTLQKLIAKDTYKQFWMIGQEDMGTFCECTSCSEGYRIYGGQSGLLIHTINLIAEKFPKHIIATFAYHETLSPPKNQLIKPRDNVLVCYAPIEAFHELPYLDLKDKRYAAFLSKWADITQHLMVWDYTENFNDFLRPYPNIYTFKPNLQFFAKVGVKYVYEESFLKGGGDLKELRTYLLAKLLWDPDLDDRNMIRQFCKLYYGKAYSHIIQYMQTVYDNSQKENDKLRAWGGTNAYLKPGYLEEYDKILARASSVTQKDSVVLRRIERLRLNIDFCILSNMVKSNTKTSLQNNISMATIKNRFEKIAKKENLIDFVTDAQWLLTSDFLKTFE